MVPVGSGVFCLCVATLQQAFKERDRSGFCPRIAELLVSIPCRRLPPRGTGMPSAVAIGSQPCMSLLQYQVVSYFNPIFANALELASLH